MVNKKERPQPDLSADFQQALYSTTRKRMRYDPPAVLTALTRLLIKPKRVAHFLKISPQLVRTMMSGGQRTPDKYLPPLTHLLRLAIVAAKGEVAKAERREIMWGNFAFPEEALQFFRERIAEAEEILAKQDKGQ